MRYITINNVKQGMIIARPLYDEKGNILLNRGHKLSATVMNRTNNMEVQGLYIDDEISQGIEIEDLIAPDLKQNALKALINNDVQGAIKYAVEVVNDLKRKDSLNVNLIDIKNSKNYTYKHCVSTCIYSVIIGLGLRLTEDQLKHLAIAAMLHDIGKFEIDEKILHKKDKLTADEMMIMREHPRHAYHKLSTYPDVSSQSRYAILHHHENENGTGYPFGKRGNEIHLLAKILHVVDVYDALCSERKYRKAHSPSEAIEHLMANSGVLYDEEVVKVFCSKFPLYPKGLTVRLSNNERAIIFSNEINNLRPVLRMFDGRLIDLSSDINYRSVIIIGID
jgi:HD-GYP domain-containing protein (c-di-GMP phosphodiesterase class II)